tara:strand:- start:1 stop:141 length:141 start_codon:yes stop_codon:yes gene_type:complete
MCQEERRGKGEYRKGEERTKGRITPQRGGLCLPLCLFLSCIFKVIF